MKKNNCSQHLITSISFNIPLFLNDLKSPKMQLSYNSIQNSSPLTLCDFVANFMVWHSNDKNQER